MVAEKRAALEDTLFAVEGAAGIDLKTGRVQPCEAIRTPLPNIARHVVESKAVGRKTPGGRKAEAAVLTGVVVWKLPLPDLAALLPFRFQFISPRKGH